MTETKVTREIVSVSEMARLLGLSRSRFYDLIKQGIFPAPLTSTPIKRPHYDRSTQQRCLEIRRTGIGLDGRPILFYQVRPREGRALISRKITSSPATAPGRANDPVVQQLQLGLKQLGLEVSDSAVQVALVTCFPSGFGEVSPEEALATIFRKLKC